jgi:hypothetical protein
MLPLIMRRNRAKANVGSSARAGAAILDICDLGYYVYGYLAAIATTFATTRVLSCTCNTQLAH